MRNGMINIMSVYYSQWIKSLCPLPVFWNANFNDGGKNDTAQKDLPSKSFSHPSAGEELEEEEEAEGDEVGDEEELLLFCCFSLLRLDEDRNGSSIGGSGVRGRPVPTTNFNRLRHDDKR